MSKKETNQTKKEVKTYTKKEVFIAILPWAIIYTLVLSVSLIIGMWFYTCKRQHSIKNTDRPRLAKTNNNIPAINICHPMA